MIIILISILINYPNLLAKMVLYYFYLNFAKGTYILYPFAVADIPETTTAFTFSSDAILNNC